MSSHQLQNQSTPLYSSTRRELVFSRTSWQTLVSHRWRPRSGSTITQRHLLQTNPSGSVDSNQQPCDTTGFRIASRMASSRFSGVRVSRTWLIFSQRSTQFNLVRKAYVHDNNQKANRPAPFNYPSKEPKKYGSI